MLTPSNAQQMSFTVDTLRQAIDSIVAAKAKLDAAFVFSQVNNLNGALKNDTPLPPGFVLTASNITDAAFWLFRTRDAIAASLAEGQAALDYFRQNVGVLVGTG